MKLDAAGREIYQMRPMANFAVSTVNMVFVPVESSAQRQVYLNVPISFRGESPEVALPAFGLSTEKDVSDLLAKHNPLLQVAGFSGSDVSALLMFLKEQVTPATPHVVVASHYGQNGDYTIYDGGWTLNL